MAPKEEEEVARKSDSSENHGLEGLTEGTAGHRLQWRPGPGKVCWAPGQEAQQGDQQMALPPSLSHSTAVTAFIP